MNELVYYNQARHALQQAAQIDEVKDVADKAKALEMYAKQHENVELENYAAEIKARAARRIGELSKALEKAPENQYTVLLPSTEKKQTKAAALKAAGLTTSKANRFEAIADLPEAEFEGFIAKKKAQNKPVKITEVEAAALSRRREKKAKETLQANPPQVPDGLFVGDFREFAKTLPDNSIELIFTDPPYDRDSIPLFGDLAEIAARVLRPGGSVIAYCGQIQLPDVLRLMSDHLRYWWVNACVHSGPKSQMDRYGIKVGWKPMVWFVKGTRGDVQTFVLDTVTGEKEKTSHEWQQAQSEAEYYIEKLSSPDGLVWEPFGGGGTTIAACQSLGRKWIACEINDMAVAAISKRVAT